MPGTVVARFGSFRRSTSTPADTSTKANSVPMLVSSTTSAMLAKAAKNATNTPVMIVPTYGVLYRGVNPSQERRQQAVPCHGHEDARLAQLKDEQHAAHRDHGARATRSAGRCVSSLGDPSASASAVIIGSGVPSLFQGAIPVMTAAMTMYKHGTDDQAHDDAERHIPRRVLGLLRGGRGGVESDVAEENDGGTGG